MPQVRVEYLHLGVNRFLPVWAELFLQCTGMCMLHCTGPHRQHCSFAWHCVFAWCFDLCWTSLCLRVLPGLKLTGTWYLLQILSFVRKHRGDADVLASFLLFLVCSVHFFFNFKGFLMEVKRVWLESFNITLILRRLKKSIYLNKYHCNV